MLLKMRGGGGGVGTTAQELVNFSNSFSEVQVMFFYFHLMIKVCTFGNLTTNSKLWFAVSRFTLTVCPHFELKICGW